MMTVTLYTKPGCQQCVLTSKKFNQAGVEFTTKDISESEEAYNEVVALGYKSLPVVVVQEADGEPTSWAGLRPDMIRDLTSKVAA